MAKICYLFYGAKTPGERKRHRHKHFHNARAKYRANVQFCSDEQLLYPGQYMHVAILFRCLNFGKKIKVIRVLVAINKSISASVGLTTKFQIEEVVWEKVKFVPVYAIRINKCTLFFINYLIQLYCLRHVSNSQVFILKKTCTCSFRFFFFVQSSRCQDVSNTSWHRPDCLYGRMKEIP